jgi:hypothetical protein
MTADEVIDFFAPEQSTTEAVMQWIVESGISADRIALSANKQVIPSLYPWTNSHLSMLSLVSVDSI